MQRAIQLKPGVNVLAGRNAENRTSLLKALAAAQGSEDVELKSDKSEGRVSLSFDDEQYERTIQKDGEITVFEGEYPVDENHVELANLFAFLFERNRARQAIRQGGNLRDIVMEPVDAESIRYEIDTLKEERSKKKDKIEQLKARRQKLPELRSQHEELTAKIEELEAELAAKQTEVDEFDADVEECDETKQKIDQKATELREAEAELERVESRISSTEQSISHLETDTEEKKEALADLPDTDEAEIADITSDLSTIRDKLARKERVMSELQSIIQFNEDMIEEDDSSSGVDTVLSELQASEDAEKTVTDQLVDTDGVMCWTCGSSTTESDIAETVERLQLVHEEFYSELEDLRDRIESLQKRKSELQDLENRQADLEASISEMESELSRNKETLESLTQEKESLEDETAALNEELERLRDEREDELLDMYQEVNNLKVDLRHAEEERDSLETEIESIEQEEADIESIEDSIEEITAEIQTLREQVETIEEEAIEGFNMHMDAILDILDYDNIERIWLESKTEMTREGRKKVEQSVFTLHVVREDDDGKAYEDTIEHLSESEREVTGLVFALAGYLVHEVHEKVPVMVLDSLEAIDSERIALLLNYFEQYAENIAVALLEEDAQAIDSDHHKITSIS